MRSRSCACGCGRPVFEANVLRGQSAHLILPDGSALYLARSAQCAGRTAQRRPDLRGLLRQHLLTGKQEGRGSGLWQRALEQTDAPQARSFETLDCFANSGERLDEAPRVQVL